MKSKLKYILLVFLCLSIIVSCEDEEKKPFDSFQKGSIPLFTANDDDTGFINLVEVNDTKISFSVTKEGQADVASIDVTATYNNSVTGSSETAILRNVNTYPSTVSIGMSELLGAFPREVVTADSLSLGDSFVIGGAMIMTDGRYLEGGYSPSIFAERPVTLTYNVACPSDLGGGFTYVTTNIRCDNCPGAVPGAAACGVSVSGSGTLEDLGGGQYELSDATFGQYGCAWADTPAAGTILNDICGNIFLTGTDQYGLNYTITFVSNNGTQLVLDWENDYGDGGRTTLTRTGGATWPLTLNTD